MFSLHTPQFISFSFISVLYLESVAFASPVASSCVIAWGQCGGIGFTGASCCVSGYYCSFSNSWYSQCLPGLGTSNIPSSTTTPATSSTTAITKTTQVSSKFSSATITRSTTTIPKTTATPASSPASGVVLATVSNVKGTYWSTQSDGGGCQMPEGSYAVIDALALGQETALASLIYKPGLCGQVLRVTCGATAVDAVVVSTCNLGSSTCGVDMISRTWSAATGGLPPGIATCSVSLTNKNPLPGSSPICYYRPSSETNNAYYVILGVLNTSGKLVASATAAGIAGTHSNGGWYEFNGNGLAVFTASASIIFKYEDGSVSSFALSSCVKPSGVHIFS